MKYIYFEIVLSKSIPQLNFFTLFTLKRRTMQWRHHNVFFSSNLDKSFIIWQFATLFLSIFISLSIPLFVSTILSLLHIMSVCLTYHFTIYLILGLLNYLIALQNIRQTLTKYTDLYILFSTNRLGLGIHPSHVGLYGILSCK